MRNTLFAGLVSALFVVGAGAAVAQDSVPAKQLFGSHMTPADLQARSIGFYSRGCLAGGVEFPPDGPDWQTMRPSRNRAWGMPVLVNYLEKLGRDAKTLDGWPGLLVGDLSQPRGGPMVSGHSSHQVGLDVDIWFDPMPDRVLSPEERNAISATSYIVRGTNTKLDTGKWTPAHSRMIKRAASYPEVERIFVNAGIKKELCDNAGRDRAWLSKIRPWYLHDDHLHVRLSCPPGMTGCTPQDPPPADDGCGSNLAWWLSSVPYADPSKPAKPVKPKPPMTLAALPSACRAVLDAPAPGLARTEINIPLPSARPSVN